MAPIVTREGDGVPDHDAPGRGRGADVVSAPVHRAVSRCASARQYAADEAMFSSVAWRPPHSASGQSSSTAASTIACACAASKP